MVTDYNTNAYMYPDQMIRAGGRYRSGCRTSGPPASGEVVTASTRRPSEERLKNIPLHRCKQQRHERHGRGHRMPGHPAALADLFMYAVDAAAAAPHRLGRAGRA